MDSLSSIKTASQLHNALNQKEADIDVNIQAKIDSLRGQQVEGMKSDTMANFAQLLLLGGGVGAGVRGLYGLANLLSGAGKSEEEEDDIVYGEPKLAEDKDDEEKDDNRPLAETWMDVIPEDMRGDSWEEERAKEVKEVQRMIERQARKTQLNSGEKQAVSPEKDLALWSSAKLPLGIAGGGLGLYGGWKLMDYLMDKRREAESDDELAEAKLEYESALRGATKESADNELSRELDSLADNMDKLANDKDWIDKVLGFLGPENVGSTLGLYGGYAVSAAGLAAMLSYPVFKKRRKKTLLEKAKKTRRRTQAAKFPKPIRLSVESLGLPKDEEDVDEAINMSPALDFEDSLDRV